MHIHHRLARLERHVRQLAAVRRPRGRDDGLGTRQCGLGVLAVGIRHPQAVAGAGLGHIGNASREDTALAGELFVDEVGNAVRDQAQVALRNDKTLPAQVLPLDHIPQAKAHIKAPIGQPRDAASGQRIRTFLAPQRDIWPCGFVQRGASSVNGAELPAALQVGLHNGGNFLGGLRLTPKRSDGDGQLGQPDAGDFHSELSKRGNGGRGDECGQQLAAQGKQRGCGRWVLGDSICGHWHPAVAEQVPKGQTRMLHTAASPL